MDPRFGEPRHLPPKLSAPLTSRAVRSGRRTPLSTIQARPDLRLWQALGAMREHRGDGHVSCLVANQIGPCESLVMQAATGRSEPESLRTKRGWSDEEWQTAVMRLREHGWLDHEERPTPAGNNARDAIEDATDRLAAPLVATLGARVVELVEAIRPLAERIMEAGEVPKLNNMGLPWPSQ